MLHHDPDDTAYWEPLIRSALPLFERCATRQGLYGPTREDARQEFLQRFCLSYDESLAMTPKEFARFAWRCAQTGIQAMRLKNGYSLCNRHLFLHEEQLPAFADDIVADHIPTPDKTLETKEHWLHRYQALDDIAEKLARINPIAWEIWDDLRRNQRTRAEIARIIGHANVGLRGAMNLLTRLVAQQFQVPVPIARRALQLMHAPQ